MLLLLRTAVGHVSGPSQSSLTTVPARPKWTSSLGSGFDGSCFSDDEDNPYDETRNTRFGYGEPGSVTLRGHEVDLMVDEFNKEMEFMFGATPPSELGTSPTHKAGDPHSHSLEKHAYGSRATTNARDHVGLNSMGNRREVFPAPSKMRADVTVLEHQPSQSSSSVALGLSHVDSAGKAAMVNVAPKADTRRVATASGRVLLGAVAFSRVAANSISKGDVLTVAKLAGIMGAKQTASLIPLCHPLLLSGVDLSLSLNEELHAVDIAATVTTVGPTGVEMEALTAVTVASLTVYDMCKAVSKDIQIAEVRLESKTGGKSGDWSRRRTHVA